MRAAYRGLAHAVAGLVAIQAAAIGLWVFGMLNWVDSGKNSVTPQVTNNELKGVTGSVGVTIHSFGAIVVLLVALALLIVSFFAKIPGGVKWAGFVFLAVVVQWLLAIASFEIPGLGALHGLNALVIAWLGWRAAKQAGVTERAVAAPEAATVR